jgi:hypothetical protein
MTETLIWRDAWVRLAQDEAPAPGGAGRRGRRTGVRLWSLLHAGALLDGPPGGADDVAFIEDDRQRLAGPRGW